MKKQFAVACALVKHDGAMYSHTVTLHINESESIDEAKGKAIESAMEMKPGFSVAQIVATEIQPMREAGLVP